MTTGHDEVGDLRPLWKSHVFERKEKKCWRREMANVTGEEVRVPAS
jgi:hypothetical protein